jgi:hypothetical protein
MASALEQPEVVVVLVVEVGVEGGLFEVGVVGRSVADLEVGAATGPGWFPPHAARPSTARSERDAHLRT